MNNPKKYQIFVSSTFTDLIAERQSAVEAILKAGHIPAGMELFTSTNKSQWEVIKRWINESDIYMLILGGRYGSVEPESGKSYTQLEYEYAQEIGKPLFSVVMSDETIGELKAKNKETENTEKLNIFRDKVLSYMSAFFNDTKDIKLAIHESLNDIIRENQLVGWVRGNSQNENIAQEFITINEENRKLREENQRLKDNQVQRLPFLSIMVNDNNELELSRDVSQANYYKLLQPIEEIPDYLANELNQETVDNYNQAIKISDEKIADYNSYQELIFSYQRLQQVISVRIQNNGNLKATSIKVRITFPDFVKIFESQEDIIDEVIELEKLAFMIIPNLTNPLMKAHQEYNKRIQEQKLPLLRTLNKFQDNQRNLLTSISPVRTLDNSILRKIHPSFSSHVENNEIIISQKELVHERQSIFDNFILVPLTKGKGKIKVYIHCEEYLKSQKYEIPLIVN